MKILSKIPEIKFDTSTEVARIEVYYLEGSNCSEWCVNYYNKGCVSIDCVAGILESIFYGNGKTYISL